MQYPIEVTEFPHQGKPITWTLWDQAHLVRCIDATRGSFEEWASNEGISHWIEHEDGEWELLNHDAVYNVENFLDFLQRDLKQIETREKE